MHPIPGAIKYDLHANILPRQVVLADDVVHPETLGPLFLRGERISRHTLRNLRDVCGIDYVYAEHEDECMCSECYMLDGKYP